MVICMQMDQAGETAPATDQDGVSRPQGFLADIGAFEFTFGHELFLPVVRR